MFNDLSRRKFLMITGKLIAGTTIAAELPSDAATPLKLDRTVRKRLLLVDDDPNLILLVKDYLEFRGYEEIITAETGREALEVLEQDLPDLIISNIMMPEMDGYTFLENIRQNKRTCLIPFMFLTAKGQHRDKIKAFNMGADRYMVKPFELEELVAQVKSLTQKCNLLTILNRWWWRSKTNIQVPFDVHLTQTEKKVVQRVATGMCNRDIAEAMNISQRTVESHVSNILGKTGLP